MKNLILLFACLLLLTSPLAAQRKAAVSKKPKVDLARKIADATPAQLPQSPTDGRPRTDAQDENLKGNVKSVIEHNADNRDARPARKLYKEDHYNETGNRVTTVDYHEGYPSAVTVFGYVDGMRVSRSGDIAYAKGEKPAPKYMMFTGRVEDNLKNPDSPKDTRYSIRHAYKYDSRGRLIEEQTFANNSELVSRTTYTFERDDRREERNYGRDGSEWSRTLEILDPSGNVVERRMYDDKDKVSDIEVNTYEFDSQGNWIVQKTVEKRIVRGRPVLKPLWTSYRTITYYP